MTALERAARAAFTADRCVWPIEDVLEDYKTIARAVLMAVIPTLKRYDSDQAGRYEDERCDYVLFDDLDAILNEKDTTND